MATGPVSLKLLGAGEGNRTLVFSLEVSGILQCFQNPFRHFAAFWAIEITTEFLFVGMAGASSMVAEHSARARGRFKAGRRNHRYRHSLMVTI